MEVFIIKKKSKNGSEYVQTNIDFGYRTVALNFDIAVAAEMAGMSFKQISELETDKKYIIGTYEMI